MFFYGHVLCVHMKKHIFKNFDITFRNSMRYFHIEHVQATGETVEENDKELIESYLN